MPIINQTNTKVLSKTYLNYNTMWKKARGLMFSKQKTLLFEFKKEQIVPLHMCFVFFQIDVLFLDSNYKVVDIKENFRPFSFYTPKNKAKYIIELKNNTIKKTNTQLGHQISINDE